MNFNVIFDRYLITLSASSDSLNLQQFQNLRSSYVVIKNRILNKFKEEAIKHVSERDRKVVDVVQR